MGEKLTIPELIRRWEKRRRVEDRLPARSGTSFYRLRALAERMGEKYLTQRLIDTWYSRLETENESSRYRRLASARRFLEYAVAEGAAGYIRIPALPKVPARGKGKPSIPYIPSEEELDNFFRATTELPPSRTGTRKAVFNMEIPVMFRMMACVGLRPVEARNLRRSDVSLESGLVRVVDASGCQTRNVVLHESMLQLAISYDAAVNGLMPDRRYFFPGMGDTPFRENRLRLYFRRCWLRYNTIPEGASGVNCNMFRYVYALRNISSWTDGDTEASLRNLLVLSRSMGHRNLETTLSYLRYSPVMARLMDDLVVAGYDEVIRSLPKKGNKDDE